MLVLQASQACSYGPSKHELPPFKTLKEIPSESISLTNCVPAVILVVVKQLATDYTIIKVLRLEELEWQHGRLTPVQSDWLNPHKFRPLGCSLYSLAAAIFDSIRR